MSYAFDDLGLQVAYDLVIDPEFPSAGIWSDRVQHFHRDALCDSKEPFRSTWGAPVVVRVEPDHSSAWIGMAEAGGAGTPTQMVAGPDPNQLIVVNEGVAYLIDVTKPGDYNAIKLMPILGVRSISDLRLVLLSSFTALVAIDKKGVCWRTDRLVLDDLRILRAGTEGIVVTGSTVEGLVDLETTIDPRTGRILSQADAASLPEPLRDRDHWERAE
jgi:hypothetical protein